MPNALCEQRSIETILATNFCRLHSEASRVTGDSYSKLVRMEKEGRLKVSSTRPKIIAADHLIEQAAKGYPVLEDALSEFGEIKQSEAS